MFVCQDCGMTISSNDSLSACPYCGGALAEENDGDNDSGS